MVAFGWVTTHVLALKRGSTMKSNLPGSRGGRGAGVLVNAFLNEFNTAPSMPKSIVSI